MHKIKLAIFAILTVALGAMLASLAMPTPQNNSWLGFHVYLATTLGLAIMYVGASWLFVKGFGGFTPKLKRAYALLCIGFSLLGLASIELPLIIYSGSVESLFRSSGLAGLPFLCALIAALLGARSFARLYGIKNISTSWWFIFGAPTILSVIYSLLPHAPISVSEFEFDGSNSFNVFNTWVNGLAMAYILQVKRIAGPQYINALAWLALVFGGIGGGGLAYLIALLPLGNEQWFLVGAAPFVPMFFAGFFLLRSAYAFNGITMAQADAELVRFAPRDFFGRPLQVGEKSQVSSVDIVIFAANLASNTSEIDPILNKLRVITAKMQPGQPPTESENEALAQVYFELENYLVEREPVRNFNRELLRKTIAGNLNLAAASQTFWREISAK